MGYDDGGAEGLARGRGVRGGVRAVRGLCRARPLPARRGRADHGGVHARHRASDGLFAVVSPRQGGDARARRRSGDTGVFLLGARRSDDGLAGVRRGADAGAGGAGGRGGRGGGRRAHLRGRDLLPRRDGARGLRAHRCGAGGGDAAVHTRRRWRSARRHRAGAPGRLVARAARARAPARRPGGGGRGAVAPAARRPLAAGRHQCARARRRRHRLPAVARRTGAGGELERSPDVRRRPRASVGGADPARVRRRDVPSRGRAFGRVRAAHRGAARPAGASVRARRHPVAVRCAPPPRARDRARHRARRRRALFGRDQPDGAR